MQTKEYDNENDNSNVIYTEIYDYKFMFMGDAGSWTTNKKKFIERGCPTRWQLTRLDGDNIWYEYPCNSKLILPNIFENECKDKIENGEFYYSEIFLNKNARPIGVFYTDQCQNIEEVKLYAETYNLPLVKMATPKNKTK